VAVVAVVTPVVSVVSTVISAAMKVPTMPSSARAATALPPTATPRLPASGTHASSRGCGNRRQFAARRE